MQAVGNGPKRILRETEGVFDGFSFSDKCSTIGFGRSFQEGKINAGGLHRMEVTMKKRILAFLLSCTLMLGGTAEGIFAEPVSADTHLPAEITADTETEETESKTNEAESLMDDTAVQSAEAGESREPKRLGGFQKPIRIDLPKEEIPEEYAEDEEQTAERNSAAYRAVWDSYSTNYYYNLLSKDQKDLWDKLDAMCYAYLTGTETLTRKDRYIDRKTGNMFDYYYTKSVAYAPSMSSTMAYNTAFLFYLSNPQYYFLQAIIDAGYGFAYLTVNQSFANGVSRQRATKGVQSIINDWVAQIQQEETDWDKEKRIHDMICEKVVYDDNYLSPSPNPYNQTVYSVFCTDSTVCAGYSQAMQLLCNAVGIDCGVVTSRDHEWNVVRLNGTWYYVDITWDDEDGGYVYDFFNRSSAAYDSFGSYSREMHTLEPIWAGYAPAVTYDSQAFGEDPGTIHIPDTSLAAPKITSAGSKAVITAPLGSTIYYTTNGGEPSAAFTKASRYTGPIPLFGTTTVKAIAVSNGYFDSDVVALSIVPRYTVTFYANGGYIGTPGKSADIRSGLLYQANAGSAPTPKRSGYAFMGWYSSPSGGSRLTGSVKATADLTFYARWAKVQPKKVSISSVKNKKKKSFFIKIKAVGTAAGYQIRYSLKKSMASSKKKNLSGNTLTVGKLKKGKTYYVQARMYQVESVSGKKKYGSWSKAKTVKIKK